METIEKAKNIISEAVKFYLDGCNIDQDSIPENYEVTEGTALSFSDLIHTSGDSVENILNELFEDGWDDEATELQRHENKCYAEILADLCEKNIGGEWNYNWDNEAIAPYSQCSGAWIIEKTLNES